MSLRDAAVLIQTVVRDWWRGRNDEEGQGLVEYGLIVVLISIAAIAAMTTMGNTIAAVFSNVSGNL